MLAFFATIGLSANLSSLKAGGRRLVLFLGIVAGMLVMQNAIGVGLAMAMGLPPGVGLLGGSITLAGGHGTGAAWGETLTSRYGVQSALEIAMACATFGLVLGGLLGGPVARYLVGRLGNRVPGAQGGQGGQGDVPEGFEQPHTVRLITAQALIETVAMIAICLLGGEVIARWLSGTALELPTFVCVLFTGVVVRNLLALVGYEVFERSLSVLGNVSLSLFLAMALMALRLWDLSTLALPMVVILVVQAIAMASYAIFVTFRVMGRNYDAAVLTAGHCGFGLGATPTAIANMQAVTERFGPSHLAFLIVPMVSASLTAGRTPSSKTASTTAPRTVITRPVAACVSHCRVGSFIGNLFVPEHRAPYPKSSDRPILPCILNQRGRRRFDADQSAEHKVVKISLLSELRHNGCRHRHSRMKRHTIDHAGQIS